MLLASAGCGGRVSGDEGVAPPPDGEAQDSPVQQALPDAASDVSSAPPPEIDAVAPADAPAVPFDSETLEASAADAPSFDATLDAAPACGTDLATLDVPDVAIGTSGVSADGCYQCIETKCRRELDACNADCSCATMFLDFVMCLDGGGNNALACGEGLAMSPDPADQALVSCFFPGTGPGCLPACVAQGGGDAGASD